MIVWLQRLAAQLYRGFASRQNTVLAWIVVLVLTGLLLIGVVGAGGLR